MISTAWLIKKEPRMRSASSKTFCSTSWTCFSSLESVTIPTTERCHAELPPQLVLQAAQNLPFVLQRLRVRDVQLEGEQADRHVRLRRTVRRSISFRRTRRSVRRLPRHLSS